MAIVPHQSHLKSSQSIPIAGCKLKVIDELATPIGIKAVNDKAANDQPFCLNDATEFLRCRLENLIQIKRLPNLDSGLKQDLLAIA